MSRGRAAYNTGEKGVHKNWGPYSKCKTWGKRSTNMSGLYTPISVSRVRLSQKLQHCDKIFVECESHFEGRELAARSMKMVKNLMAPFCPLIIKMLSEVCHGVGYFLL